MPHRFRFAPIALVTMLVALAAAGCGSSQPHKLSALVTAADPICKEVAEKRAAANAALQNVSSSTAKSLALLAKLAPGVAKVEHEEAVTLDALKQNGSASQDWKTILTGMQQLANDTTQLAADAKAGNITAVHSVIASGRTIQQKLAVIAERDGFTYCGRTS
jgi:hypothetical protein